MSVAVVSTSINKRPEAYAAWAKQCDQLFVAGDRNSPRELEEYIAELGGTYIRPGLQDHWTFSDAIGWNCIQRRNAAVMEAYRQKFDYIVTVDDDNYPADDFILEHVSNMQRPARHHLTSKAGWINLGDFVKPRTNQRGHPLGFVHQYIYEDLPERAPIVVAQAPVLGAPDCDAVTRLAHNPIVTAVREDIHITGDMYAPFNSQATMWVRDWAPFIACLPGVGRYDDIFAGLIAQRVMREYGVAMYAGKPTVVQKRNEHNVVKDLEAEVFGMERVFAFVACLNAMTPLCTQLYSVYDKCTDALEQLLPRQTIQFMRAWVSEWMLCF